MKFFKYFRADLRYGFMDTWKKHCVIFVLFTLLCGYFILMLSTPGMKEIKQTPPTFGEFLIYILTGMKKYIIHVGEPFQFPALWLFIFMLLYYTILQYPYRNLAGIGKQVLVYGGNRKAWWFSKCCWVIISCCLYCLLPFLSFALLKCFFEMEWSLQLSPYAPDIFQFDTSILHAPPWDIRLFLIGAACMFIFIALLQLLLSMFLRPLFAYICCVSLLFSSAYFQHSALIGNSLMAARSIVFVEQGISISITLWVSVIGMIACIFIGSILFRHYSIIREDDFGGD